MGTRVINLFAGPGSGKSTTAAGLFYLMKIAGYKVELVNEFAKELVYEGRIKQVSQARIMAEQAWRQKRLEGKVDWLITDCPLLLPVIYGSDLEVAHRAFSERTNHNFFIERVKPYAPYGRVQSEDEARALDRDVLELLYETDTPYMAVRGGPEAPFDILKAIEEGY